MAPRRDTGTAASAEAADLALARSPTAVFDVLEEGARGGGAKASAKEAHSTTHKTTFTGLPTIIARGLITLRSQKKAREKRKANRQFSQVKTSQS